MVVDASDSAATPTIVRDYQVPDDGDAKGITVLGGAVYVGVQIQAGGGPGGPGGPPGGPGGQSAKPTFPR